MPERDGDESPFTARLSRLTAAPIFHVRYQEITACRVRRGAREIARQAFGAYTIYQEGSVGAWFSRAGQEFTTETGDLVIADLDLPFETRALSAAYTHDVWVLPKAALAPYLPPAGRTTLYKLGATNGAGQLLAAYLGVLTREAANMAPDTRDRASDILYRLVGIACGASAEAQPEAMREARLAEAKRYIERHLADPHLGPARVATALGLSLRSLHAVFEPAGTSVARHILRRRLEECRATLLSDRKRPVTDIAFAWGFNSLSGFYRAFQAAFGASPGDLRAAARTLPQH